MTDPKMSERRRHLAQVNIATMRRNLDDPVMAGLVARVEEMNALGERSRGFVWRLRAEDIDEKELQAFAPYLISFAPSRLFYNMSVEGIADLKQFVTKTAHADMLRDRHNWILHSARTTLALWWIPIGHRPTIAESAMRLRSVHENGPTKDAFTFDVPFGAL
jgi:Domain of unknown function (DUF3291)